MIFDPVNEVPNKKRAARHDLASMLKDFVEGDKEIVKIILVKGDYKSPKICYSCLGVAARRHKMPVKVMYRDGEVYLKKV